MITGKYRDSGGNIEKSKLISAMALGMVAYFCITSAVFHFVLGVPISKSISNMGEERVAWVFVILVGDVVGRLAALFDE